MVFLWIFVLLPVIEIALFVVIGGEIGVWATLAWVLLAAMAGVALIRWQGAQAALDLQQSLNDLRDPSAKVAHRTLLILAGVLLILPGFFTDALAILLLIPMVRNLMLRQIASRARAGMGPSGGRFTYGYPAGQGRTRDSGVIDGEYVVQDDPYPAQTGLPSSGDGKPEANGPTGPSNHGKSGWTRH